MTRLKEPGNAGAGKGKDSFGGRKIMGLVMFCWISRPDFSAPCSLNVIRDFCAWNQGENSNP
jgi:hypothetical protein